MKALSPYARRSINPLFPGRVVPLLVLCAALGLPFPLPLFANRVQTLDEFRYPSQAKAEAAWTAGRNTPAVVVETGALRFPCPFSEDYERASWDRELALDLSREQVFQLDLFCANPMAIRSVALYFKSGAGWYLWMSPLREAGRQTLVFSKKTVSTEGAPAGWNRISAIRIGVNRAAALDTELRLIRLTAEVCSIAVVQGTLSAPADEKNAARNAAQRISRRLNEAGIAHAALDDGDVIAGGLNAGVRVAILAYNPTPPASEIKALTRFVKDGGKLVVFYSSEPALAELMKVRLGGYATAQEHGQWSGFAFNRSTPEGVPDNVFQESANIRKMAPADESARVIATWVDAGGFPGRDAAWIQSGNGFWMSHILLDGDDDNKALMLAGFLGVYDSSVWPAVAARALSASGKINSCFSYEETVREFSSPARRASQKTDVQRLLQEADTTRQSMIEDYNKRHYPAAVRRGRRLKALLTEAYSRLQDPRAREFRGVWNHSGLGLIPGSWRASCRLLSESGMTAVFPNVLWAGSAHYKSRIVPLSTPGRLYGDQLQQCLDAAHAYRLEVHAWKVCWNLDNAPASFVDRLKKAGRLQVSSEGRTLDWLCPTNPDNIADELGAIRELLEAYAVDGLHLDYIRYPGSHACFCKGCKARFEQALEQTVGLWPESARNGRFSEAYAAWRAGQITAFVKAVHDEIRRINPKIRLSAAVYGNYPECAKTLGQDWGQWLDEKLVDFVCPMTYFNDPATFQLALRKHLALPGAKGRIYPGIGVTALESRLAPDEVIEQIGLLRDQRAAGFMLFELNRTLERETLPVLRLGPTRE
ncbi:MAG: family 10 glycosylhydrolase [Lentisphaerae bacterium]|nr:family 10 glycosylhydrolase [Lentisphaerota bacterium]